MTLLSKLGFVHRTLWQRDPLYRWAAMLGPPPLIGFALAAAALAGWSHLEPTPASGRNAPWAVWQPPVVHADHPLDETIAAMLPQTDSSGHPSGFRTGWLGAIQPMTIGSDDDPNVIPERIAHFTTDQTALALDRVVEASPPTGLFVAVTEAYLALHKAGVYGLSVRLTRSSPVAANCIVRLGSLHYRLERNVTLNVVGDGRIDYPVAEIRAQRGLISISMATGCWRGDRMIGPGEVTLMILSLIHI